MVERVKLKDPQPELEPDLAAIREFLLVLRPHGPWLLTSFPAERGGSGPARTFTDIKEAVDAAVKWNRNHNVYYQVARCRDGLAQKAKKSDITTIEFLHVDADPDADESSADFKRRMLPTLKTFDPAPSLMIDSGNGMQILWRLTKPIRLNCKHDGTIADVEARNAALADRLKAPRGTQNADRVLRVAGTINYPSAAKLKKGRAQCLSRLIEANDKEYPLMVLPAA
jgi:hypothetical protein